MKVVASCILLHQERVPRRIYRNCGDSCFAAAGPKLWNSLPADLQQADIVFQQFKQLLTKDIFVLVAMTARDGWDC